MNNQEPCLNCGKTIREQMKGCSQITCYRQFLPKQETIEEAFEKWSSSQDGYDKLDVLRFGANWQKHQSEKMFSEEEVLRLLVDFHNDNAFTKSPRITEWLTQHKKH